MAERNDSHLLDGGDSQSSGTGTSDRVQDTSRM